MKVLSLFSNIGVAEAYLLDIGVDVVLANELIERRAALYSKIYPGTKMICGDITDSQTYSSIVSNAKLLNIDTIMATPPCQGISRAGKQYKDDVRNLLILPVISLIRELNPRYVFIENVPQFVETYISVERNPKVVNDDYVKFIRFAQDVIKNEDNAIIAYVTPHSFTDNLTFRGMRWNLLHSFDSIYIFDLHGNVMSRESTGMGTRDENIFDIQQGVCICFFIKKSPKSSQFANIFYADMYGSRESKYHFLSTQEFENVEWQIVTPVSPYYFFKPKDLSQAQSYDTGIQLSKLFPNFLGGIKTHSDETLVSLTAFDTGFDQLYDYRPFDIQHINYDLSKVERNRFEIMRNFIGHENYGLVMDRQIVTDNWSHIQIVRNMVDNRVHYSRKGIPVECPMFLYDERGNATPNIDMRELEEFGAGLNETFSPTLTEDPKNYDMMDIFDYCYGVLSSNSYRLKYCELLSIDFPKVPAPINSDYFWQVVQLGAELRRLFLFEQPTGNALNIQIRGTGDFVISNLKYENERVYINRNQYFSNVREDIWDFCFGGYHGLQKWFKDRKQTMLTPNDIQHAINVFNAFDQAEAHMASLDSLLAEYQII